MNPAHLFKLQVHRVHYYEDDEDEVYEKKMKLLLDILPIIAKKKKFERTIILTQDDKLIPLTTCNLNCNGYKCMAFPERALKQECSIMEAKLEEFRNGTFPFATCSMALLKKVAELELADHYIFFELPIEVSDIRRLLEIVESKADAVEKFLRIDVFTTELDDRDKWDALVLELDNRKMKVASFLREQPDETRKPRSTSQESVSSRKTEKRQRTPTPTSIYDIHVSADGKYRVPAKFLKFSTLSDDDDSDDGLEVVDRDYNSEEEYLPPWMLD
uniref:FTH domain-containing protein n=1 Tax=Caenorhabditis tropicalis TaxID=1561998 RepID=A0A1I7TN35_9PELO